QLLVRLILYIVSLLLTQTLPPPLSFPYTTLFRSHLSSVCTPRLSAEPTALHQWFPYVCTTPLGFPVVPDVERIVNGSLKLISHRRITSFSSNCSISEKRKTVKDD